nr:hypothetical protein CFP56_46673 [Quercus suber]
MAARDQRGSEQTAGAPEEGGDALHAHDERVAGEVARVGEGVLLPHLADEGLRRAQRHEVRGVVALEEDVDAARQHEPHDGEQLAAAQRRLRAPRDDEGQGEEGGAGAEEDAQQCRHAPFIGGVVGDDGVVGIVGVQGLGGEFGEVGGEGLHAGDDEGGWMRLVVQERIGDGGKEGDGRGSRVAFGSQCRSGANETGFVIAVSVSRKSGTMSSSGKSGEHVRVMHGHLDEPGRGWWW